MKYNLIEMNSKQIKPKYYIGNLEFNTKKECENYTRNVINLLGCCTIKKDNLHFDFFINLLKNHQDCEMKTGVGIDYFYIKPNLLLKKCYQTMIKRIDGSDIDFSWVHCCQFKERTPNYNLVCALRSSIKDVIINYKQNQAKLICNICKSENESYENYHVDHNNPSFQTLKNNFLQQTTIPIPLIFGECTKYNLTIFNDEDKKFENDWIQYHNNHCNLQILCKKCNLSKTKI
jgi:hypothetical protein